MRRAALLVIAVAILLSYLTVLEKTASAWKQVPRIDSADRAMPSPVLKIISLEFDGLLSDYLFMKTLVFMGGRIQEGKRFVLTAEEWSWVHQLVTAASDLDPCFVDPYYLANAYLTWDAGMVQEANSLLEKGTRSRSWDWTLPFFLGFNHFYFLQDGERASEYLFAAAQRPGASPILASIASKLAMKANRLESSIAFLEQMLDRTEDDVQRKEFQMRIDALRVRLFLASMVERYRTVHGRTPRRIDDLVSGGILTELPPDPAGGIFSLNREGSVVSTADERLEARRRS